MTVRAAIVGLGRWGRNLVDSVHGKTEALRFVAAQTRTPSAAADYCKERGLPLLDSYADVLARPDVDAVVLATPHSRHAEQMIAAAAAGKHIFVEKPMALSQADAQRAADAARRAGVVLAVGFNRRFQPALREVRRRLVAGRLGEPVSAVVVQTTSSGRGLGADHWRKLAVESPAGALTPVGVHGLDAMIALLGEVAEVLCAAPRPCEEPNDATHIMLRFKSGATGMLMCTTTNLLSFRFSLFGTKGLAEISGPGMERLRFASMGTGQGAAPPEEALESGGVDTLNAELVAFADAVAGGAPYAVPVEEALHGMAVFDAVVRSAESGKVERVA